MIVRGHCFAPVRPSFLSCLNLIYTPVKSQVPLVEVLIIGCDRHPEVPVIVEIKTIKGSWLVVLLFYVHGKHLRSCRDGQLT